MTHLLMLPTLSVFSLACASAQETPLKFIIDAPGPAYREFWQGIRIIPPPEPSTFLDTRFPLDSKSVIESGIQETKHGDALIYLTFNSTKHEDIRRFLEDNRQKKVLVELGDYILPIDFAKTLPWRGTVWTQSRKPDKMKVIHESFRKQK